MKPKLTGIDHVHVYVDSWEEAEPWYRDVLGFSRVDELAIWAVNNGPLTLEDESRTAHIALFEAQQPRTSTVAFGATGEEFLRWKTHLEGRDLKLRVTDHKLAWSMYFSDPFGNMHEITTYEHDFVRARIEAS